MVCARVSVCVCMCLCVRACVHTWERHKPEHDSNHKYLYAKCVCIYIWVRCVNIYISFIILAILLCIYAHAFV